MSAWDPWWVHGDYAETYHGGPSMTYAVRERCEYCEFGWVEGRPWPTPDGPHYPYSRCKACNGDGWIVVEYESLSENDAFDRDAALASMGEDDDSLMLGGCGGGERDPDLEWY